MLRHAISGIHLLLFVLLTPWVAKAQVIWSEDFTYPNNTSVGANNNTANPFNDWTSSCPTCLAGDWFTVQSNRLEGLDTNGPASMTTESIDISAFPAGVELRVELSEAGTMEGCTAGCGCNCIDWFMVEISLDGAPFQPLSSPLGGVCNNACGTGIFTAIDDFTSTTFSECPISATTLQIRITVQTWAADEFARVDNLVVQANSCLLEMKTFAAVDEGEEVALNWSTVVGSATDRFEVERSIGEGAFAKIATVYPTADVNDYTYTDPSDFSGMALYRVLEYNVDGKVSMSETQRIVREDISAPALQICPNPAGATLNVTAEGAPLQRIRVLDLSGREVLHTELSEVFSTSLNIGSLPRGLYLLVATLEGVTLTERFVRE